MPGVWNKERAEAIIGERLSLEGPVLPILHALQAEFGCIPEEAVPMVAEAVNRTRAEIHGVVTFYHDFRKTPAARHVLKLCRAEACQSVGADALHDHVHAKLGTAWGDTTRSGKLTVEPIFCLGLCAMGPAALLDGEPIGRLDAARADELVEACER